MPFTLDQFINPNIGFPQQNNQMLQRPQMPAQNYQFSQPQYDAQNRFASELQNVPEPNKPSFGRKLGASLAGLASNDPFGTAQNIAFNPYFHQLALRQQRLPMLQQAADNERMSNTAGMEADNRFRTQLLNQEKADTTARQTDDRIKIAQQNADTSTRRAEIYAKIAKGGTIAYDEKTGQGKMVYKDGTTEPVDVMHLTPEQQRELIIQGQLKIVRAQGANQQANIAAQGKNQQALESARQKNREVNLVERNRVWNLLPSQQRQQIQNNYEQIIRENPAYDEFFEVDANTGRIGLVEENEGDGGFLGFGASPALDKPTRDLLLQRLNAGVNTPRSTSTTTPVIGGASSNDRITVEKDGKQFSLPKSQLQQAIAQGFKEVK
jgi:hypothetical protein